MKRWIWFALLLIPLYYLLDGQASAYVLARVAVSPAELVSNNGPKERRIPVWLQLTFTETRPEGSARRISGSGIPLGFRQTYEVPGGERVDCRHWPFGNACSGGWSYVFSTRAIE